MHRPTRIRCARWIAALALGLAGGPTPAADRYALLIGVNDYKPPLRSLEGPENDVAALRDVLVSRWGMPADRVTVLRDSDASRLGILNGVTSILARSKPGDHVMIFFAGHGTSAADLALGTALPHTTGALLPSDFDQMSDAFLDQLIIGRRDLRPLIEALDRGGRRVFVVIDACYSGNSVRGASLAATGRPPLPGRAADAVAARAGRRYTERAAPEPYPYRNVVYLAAAAEHEVAAEIPAEYVKYYPTRDGRAHGAFSDALLRGLDAELPGTDRDGDGAASYAELFGAVARFMQAQGYPQTPQLLPALGDGAWVASGPVLGADAATVKFDAGAADTPEALAIRLEGASPAVRERLQKEPGVELVESAERLVLAADGNELKLVSTGGDTVGTARGDDLDRLLTIVRRIIWVDGLMRRTKGAPALDLGLGDDGLGRTRLAGDPVALRMRSARDAWLAVIAIDPEGTPVLLWPAFPSESDQKVRAGRTVVLDAVHVSPPFGFDTAVALAFPARPGWLLPFVGRDIGRGADAQALLDATRAHADGASAATVTLFTAPR